MKFSIIAAVVSTSFTTFVSAKDKVSPPFHLQLDVGNSSPLNKQYLFACHTGAAEETMCPSTTIPAPPDDISWDFGWNYTCARDGRELGNLTWEEPYNGNQFAPQIMTFSDLPESTQNTKVMLITFDGDLATVGFDKEEKMFVAGYDSKTKEHEKLYRWYMCDTDWEGYNYTTLNWLPRGDAKPSNPSCVSTNITRHFY